METLQKPLLPNSRDQNSIAAERQQQQQQQQAQRPSNQSSSSSSAGVVSLSLRHALAHRDLVMMEVLSPWQVRAVLTITWGTVAVGVLLLYLLAQNPLESVALREGATSCQPQLQSFNTCIEAIQIPMCVPWNRSSTGMPYERGHFFGNLDVKLDGMEEFNRFFAIVLEVVTKNDTDCSALPTLNVTQSLINNSVIFSNFLSKPEENFAAEFNPCANELGDHQCCEAILMSSIGPMFEWNGNFAAYIEGNHSELDSLCNFEQSNIKQVSISWRFPNVATTMYAQISLRGILLISALIYCPLWILHVFRSLGSKRLPEHDWIAMLMLGMVFYQDVTYIPRMFFSNRALVFASVVLYSTANAFFFVFLLLMLDGMRIGYGLELHRSSGPKNSHRISAFIFYLPKFLFGVGVVAAFGINTLEISISADIYRLLYTKQPSVLQQVLGSNSPGLGRMPWYTLFYVSVWVVWAAWIIALVLMTKKALRKTSYVRTRWRQLSFRFFLLLSMLIPLYLIATKIARSFISASPVDFNPVATLLVFGTYAGITAMIYTPITAIKFSNAAVTQQQQFASNFGREIVNFEQEVPPFDLEYPVFCKESSLLCHHICGEVYYSPPWRSTRRQGRELNLTRFGQKLQFFLSTAEASSDVHALISMGIRDAQKAEAAVLIQRIWRHKMMAARSSQTPIRASKRKSVLNCMYSPLPPLSSSSLSSTSSPPAPLSSQSSSSLSPPCPSSPRPPPPPPPQFIKRTQVVVAFRGTVSAANLRSDLRGFPVYMEEDHPLWQALISSKLVSRRTTVLGFNTRQSQPRVHEGFWNSYKSISEGVVTAVKTMGEMYGPLDIFVCGHSLGGALATLAALELQLRMRELGPHRVQMYTYGAPRVGNRTFAAAFNKAVPQAFRIAVDHDFLTTVPKMLVYKHVGIEVIIDNFGNILYNPAYVERKFRPARTGLRCHSHKKYLKCLRASIPSNILELMKDNIGTVVVEDQIPIPAAYQHKPNMYARFKSLARTWVFSHQVEVDAHNQGRSVLLTESSTGSTASRKNSNNLDIEAGGSNNNNQTTEDEYEEEDDDDDDDDNVSDPTSECLTNPRSSAMELRSFDT